ncbi:MAG: hypothetical protein KC636_40110, partial [Myxococcales bacterium]|nr:hypothetical protein [Myxococcales bacterium]
MRASGPLHRLVRRTIGRARRAARWEYWSPLPFYLPLAPAIAWQALRAGGAAVLTAANPAIEHGGLVGESKWELDALLRRGVAELLPATLLLPRSEPAADRIARAEAFVRERGLGYPVVLKPDVGHRGLGVLVAREPAALRARLERTQIDLLLQEYIGGTEYGVSYARRPGARGRVTSICPKIPV